MNNSNNFHNSFRPYREFDKFFNHGLNNFWANDNIKDVPSFNIKTDDNSYTIELEAPGLNKSDFNLSIKESNLDIKVAKAKAETNESKEAVSGKYLKREFGFNNFSRKFKLDKTISADNIQATYENGILSVKLQKNNTPDIIRKIEIV